MYNFDIIKSMIIYIDIIDNLQNYLKYDNNFFYKENIIKNIKKLNNIDKNDISFSHIEELLDIIYNCDNILNNLNLIKCNIYDLNLINKNIIEYKSHIIKLTKNIIKHFEYHKNFVNSNNKILIEMNLYKLNKYCLKHNIILS